MRFCLIVLALSLSTVCAYKIVVFAPDISNSQLIWNARVSEKLVEAGHDVTLVRMKYFNINKTDVTINPKVKVWTLYMAATDQDYEGMQRQHAKLIYTDAPIWSEHARKSIHIMTTFLRDACENLLMQKDILQQLSDAKFDLAFSHMYDFCPIGLIHHAKIPTWIWLNSGQLKDDVAGSMGVPIPASYVPPMMSDAKDEMTFIQRLKSQLGHTLTPLLYPRLVTWPETEIFQKHIDPNFPYLGDLASQCPLVMVNSNELYDIPRPTLHKIVNVGGLGMKFADAKPLKGNIKEIVDNADSVILFSLGSVANPAYMPYEWKQALMKAFSRFPQHQFIVRYDGSDIDDIRPKNVHLSSWIPQTDLLQHPKTRAFITHGGYNSLQEAINAAMPVVMIPLFGDQPRNSRLAEKHGFGVYLAKNEIAEENVYAAIEEILKEKYAKAAKLMRAMVEKKPIQPEQLFLRWTEFLAEFKELPNLVPHGTKLGFVQYHNLDVLATLGVIALILVTIVFKILKLFVMLGRWILRKAVSRKEKTQ